MKVLDAHHPGTRVIGRVSEQGGRVTAPTLGLLGDRGGLREA